MLVTEIDGALLGRMLRNGADSLASNVDYLNGVNVFPVSDSDTGTNMRNTLEAGVASLIDDASFSCVMQAFVKGMLIGSRGNSGLILSQYFRGLHEHTQGQGAVSVPGLCEALQHAAQCAWRAVLHPVDGTMLTVMRDGISRTLPRITHDTSVTEFFDLLAGEMFLCMRETTEQMDVLRKNNVVDSGALGFFLVIDGMKRTLNDDPQFFECAQSDLLPKRRADVAGCVSFFRYCTEFVMKGGETCDRKFFTALLEGKGDSIVVARDEDILKVHIHTNRPQEITDEFSHYGSIIKRKTDDLFMTEEFERLRQRKHQGFAVLAFTDGEGDAAMLEQLGADVAFAVPFRHSPSEEELAMLIDGFVAEDLIIFADDKEIQERFRRIKWFSNLQNLCVVETDGLPRTFFTLSSLVFSDDFSGIVKSLDGLKRQRVFQASITAEVEIGQRWYAGSSGRKVFTNDDLSALLEAVAGDKVLRPYSTVVVFGGVQATPDEVESVRAFFEKNSACDFTYVDGRHHAGDLIIGAF